MSAAWIVVKTEDLQNYMQAAIVGNSIIDGAADPQAPGGGYRSDAALLGAVERVRGAIVAGGRIPLSLTPSSVPPEARQHTLILAIYAMAAAVPTLGPFVASEPFKDLNAKAEKWLERVEEGGVVTTPADPDTTNFSGPSWGDLYGENTAGVGGQVDLTTDQGAVTTGTDAEVDDGQV